MRVKETSFISNSSHHPLDLTDLEDDCDDIILHAQRKVWDNMSFSTDPEYVMENYRHCLSELEISEILNYNHIYCIADKQNKLNTSNPEDYQDDDGMYVLIPGDQIKYRYEVIELIGKGTYAQVVKAYDHKTHNEVAIKLINSENYNVASSEAKVLEYIKQHDGCRHNIVELQKRFFFRNYACFVFKLAKCSLFDYIKEKGSLSMDLIRKFSIQILEGLNFLSHHGIIHCDLKAENILVEESDDHELNVKIADFGLACFDSDELYSKVQSLWCRAPEVLLEIEYSTQIDMWAFGCILAFMYTGKYTFKGAGSKDQLYAIIEVLGVPCDKLVQCSMNKEIWFEKNGCLRVQKQRGARNRVPSSVSLENILGGADRKFVEFVKETFRCDPDDRITPETALKNEWILEGIYNNNEKVNNEEICNVDSIDERDSNNIAVPCRSSFDCSSRNLFKCVV